MVIYDFIVANWVEIVAAFVAGVAFARALVRLTPTKRDDELLETILNTLEIFESFIPAPKAPDVASTAAKAVTPVVAPK